MENLFMDHCPLPSICFKEPVMKATNNWEEDGRFMEDDCPNFHRVHSNDSMTPSTSNYYSDALTDTEEMHIAAKCFSKDDNDTSCVGGAYLWWFWMAPLKEIICLQTIEVLFLYLKGRIVVEDLYLHEEIGKMVEVLYYYQEGEKGVKVIFLRRQIVENVPSAVPEEHGDLPDKMTSGDDPPCRSFASKFSQKKLSVNPNRPRRPNESEGFLVANRWFGCHKPQNWMANISCRKITITVDSFWQCTDNFWRFSGDMSVVVPLVIPSVMSSGKPPVHYQ
ncbi:hypothetical protein MA16_Dca008397 [Dendrobium catenatum]|uniref:Uncharacterized protein n=1 Tax=Dendrobium catenatum TaxID=906689 RepID=A0A2I0VM31_9ASPA|nr:hypothetical protein MA16_Dca008397 [Dendrobium catenatum]